MADDNDTNDDGLSQEELEQQAQQAVEDGRAMQKITQLLQDNYEQREQLRQLRDKAPGEDDVVLSAEQATELHELGVLDGGEVQTDEIEETLEEGREARQKLQQIETKKHRQQVAKAAGVNADALEMATKGLGADVEYEIQGEGENASVVAKPEEGDPQDFDEFAEKHFAFVQKALYDTGSDEEGDGDDTPDQEPGPSGPSSPAPSTQAGEGNRPSSDGEDEDSGPSSGGRGYRFESSSDAEW